VSEWQTDETITADKLNQKEVYIGSSAPSNPTDGQLWFDTVNKKLKYYDADAATWRVVPRVLTDLESRSHADLQNIGTDDHHPKIHGHSEHSFGEAEVVANKDAANGYAPLDSEKLLPNRLFRVKPSNTQRFNNATERTTNSSIPEKIKEIKVNKAIRGSIRIKFDMKRGGSSGIAHARIHKNGSPIGTEQTCAGDYTTKSEDIAGSFEVDDLIQIYAWVSDGATAVYCKNFALYYDLDNFLNVDFTSQDP